MGHRTTFRDVRGRNWIVNDKRPRAGTRATLQLRRGTGNIDVAQGIVGAPGIGCGDSVIANAPLSLAPCAGIALSRLVRLPESSDDVMRALGAIRIQNVPEDEDFEETKAGLLRWECDVLVAAVSPAYMRQLFGYAKGPMSKSAKNLYKMTIYHLMRGDAVEGTWGLLQLRSGDYGTAGESLADNVFISCGLDPNYPLEERQQNFESKRVMFREFAKSMAESRGL